MSSVFSKFINTDPKTPSLAAPAPELAVVTDIPVNPLPAANVKTMPIAETIKSLMTNKAFLLGSFGFIMLAVAISLQVAARSRSTTTPTEVPVNPSLEITGTNTITSDWQLYKDPYNAYLIKYPSTWTSDASSTTIETTKTFSLPDMVKLEIGVTTTKTNSVDGYLQDLDSKRSTAWEGSPSRVVNRVAPIRIGSFDGFERSELISAAGIEYIVAYIMIDEDVFSFSLIPGGGEKSIVNQETIRQFHLALQTFDITNKSDRLGEWKTYETTKIEGIKFPAYNISFPATWGISEKQSANSSTITIARNGYKITLNQSSIGEAVCLFKDSPTFQGSSGDLRAKDYTEYTTEGNYILRRYFKGNEGDSSIFLFCGKQEQDQYFVTPIIMGGLTYTVPARFDDGVIKEMDNIIKTLQAR